jgi:hypothetical protein
VRVFTGISPHTSQVAWNGSQKGYLLCLAGATGLQDLLALSNTGRGALGSCFQFVTGFGVFLFSFQKGASSPLWLLCTLLFINETTQLSCVVREKKSRYKKILRLMILMIPF